MFVPVSRLEAYLRDADGGAGDADAQELIGHRGFKTRLIYADYAPSEREAEWVEEAFRPAAPGVINSPATT
jgi:hypothetical protein